MVAGLQTINQVDVLGHSACSLRANGMEIMDTMDAITLCGQQTVILLIRRLCVRVAPGVLICVGVRVVDPHICGFETCQFGRFFFCVQVNDSFLCSKVRDSSSLLKTEDAKGISNFLE